MRETLACSSTFRVVLFALWLCGCSTEADSNKDLPSGWAGAERVADLVQVECSDGGFDFSNETATFRPGDASVVVDYEEAHFRCEQTVEGFFKLDGSALDILVQPVDMHPSAVAGCDCAYGIQFTIKPLASGAVQTTLYRRWDDLNEPNEPVTIATELVTIP